MRSGAGKWSTDPTAVSPNPRGSWCADRFWRDFSSLLFGNSIAARLLWRIEPILPNPAAAGATAHGQRQQKDQGDRKLNGGASCPEYARRTRRFLGSVKPEGLLIVPAHTVSTVSIRHARRGLQDDR